MNTDMTTEELLTRGVENIFPNKEFLEAKIAKGEKLSFYLGIDPTGPTLHIGHLIPLRKLSQFQKAGHKIILLIGDFTAMIGDPTDKTAARKKLSREEVLKNCAIYKEQASKFISFAGDNAAEFRFNSEWLAQMNFADVLELASEMTVDQMLKRDMFATRQEEGKPIYLHEFLYPLMQGYDSVALDVDGEVGGNDQTFNMLAGRDLLKSLKGKEKFVVAVKLLVDPTGKKMGKSEGNMVSLDQTPEDMFGKIMSWPDTMITTVFEILTDVSLSEIADIKESIENGANPKDAKVRLAKEIITMCHDADAAEKAAESFTKTFAEGGIPEDVEEIEAGSDEKLIDILTASGVVESKTDFRRLVGEGAVTHMDSGIKVADFTAFAEEGVYKIGKRRFVKVVFK